MPAAIMTESCGRFPKGCEAVGLLDNFARVRVYRPDVPHILRWIDVERQVVYINTSADPEAKVIVLV